MPPVLDNIPATITDCLVLRLKETGAEMYEKVTSCLVREGFSLTLELDIAQTNTLYFFIKDRPVAPRVRRLKSVKGRPGGGKPRVVSLRRKMVTRQMSSSSGGGGRIVPRAAPQKLAWWQQASTDSSEWETETEDERDDN